MKTIKLTAAAALAATVAACTGTMVSVVEPTPPIGTYYNGDFEYATRIGAIRTEVIGTPFAVTPDALKSRVLALMKGQNRGKPAEFVTQNGDKTDAAYKVVAAFNLWPNYGGYDLCKYSADKLQTTGPSAETRLTIAFCFTDDMKTEVNGRVSGLTGLNDPKFVALVRQTTLGLIPPYDHQETGGSNRNN